MQASSGSVEGPAVGLWSNAAAGGGDGGGAVGGQPQPADASGSSRSMARPVAAAQAAEGEPKALLSAWQEEEDAEQQQMEEGPADFTLARSASPREFLKLEWRIAEARADAASSQSWGASSPLSCLMPSSALQRKRRRPPPLGKAGGSGGAVSMSSSASLATLAEEESGATASDAGAVAGGSTGIQREPTPPPPAAAEKGQAADKAGGQRRRRPLLLQGIAGRSQSGDLTAVIGPSGAGKTTLLHCLSLRVRKFQGALRLNGKSPGSAYTATAALVHQHEVLFGYMTVREHLEYHAAARMGPRRHKRPRPVPEGEAIKEGEEEEVQEMVTTWESRESQRGRQRQRVAEVMAEVGLAKAADTVIGGTPPLYNGKGISGGEKRRLAIATELLLCPSLLFLDEPTSGLDGVMADSVIASLKSLADHRGVLIMASVHCPSSDAARAFTHLLLLTPDGRQAYHGPMADALPYFQSLGHRLPPACNPCDFFLELVSKTPPSPGSSPLHSPIHQQQLQLFSSGTRPGFAAKEGDEEMGSALPSLVLPSPAAMAAAAAARRERRSSVCSRDEQEEGKEHGDVEGVMGTSAPSTVAAPTAPTSPALSTSSSNDTSGGMQELPPPVAVTVITQEQTPGRCKLLRAGTPPEGGSSTSTDSGRSSSQASSQGSTGGGSTQGEDEIAAASPGTAKLAPAPAWWWRLVPSALLDRFVGHGGSWRPAGVLSVRRCDSWESGEESVESVARPVPPKRPGALAIDGSVAPEQEEEDEEKEEAAFRAHLDRLVASYQASPFCPTPPLPCESAHHRFPGVQRRGAGALTLLRLNLWRGWLQAKRNFIGCFGAVVALMGSVGLLIGAIYAGQATKQGRDLIGMLFAASVTILFNCAIAHMVRFPLEAGVVLREYLCGANAIGPYVAAKMVSDVPYMLAPLAFSFGLYWTAGLLPDWGAFWAFTGVLTLMSQASMSLGVALACFSLDPAIGLTLLPLATAPMVLFSGVLYDQASIPPALAWMASFSIVNHGFELLLALQAPALPPGQPEQALAFIGVDPSPKSLRGHVGALGAILAASYVVTYLGLKVRSRFFPPAY